MAKVTPLLRFIRALDADQRKAFAAAVGTTEGYLYQLAAAPQPNPRLQQRLRDEMARVRREIELDPGEEPISLARPRVRSYGRVMRPL